MKIKRTHIFQRRTRKKKTEGASIFPQDIPISGEDVEEAITRADDGEKHKRAREVLLVDAMKDVVFAIEAPLSRSFMSET